MFAAENCDDAFMLARSNEFDFYLIDNWIAECSGIDLCKRLREFNPRTPVLFYSGAAYENDKQQAFAAGAQGYLVKPVGAMSCSITQLQTAQKEHNAFSACL